MDARLLDARNVRDLAPEVLASEGTPKIMPASYYAGTTLEERAMFCVQHGLYCLPTTELIDWLRAFIGERSALEIGAGNGALAEALGIPATDSKLQRDPFIRVFYTAFDQPIVTYGANVETLTANDAVRQYEPQVVVAAWVTHKYDVANETAEGNMFGVDEADLLEHCEWYVFIGNEHVHRGKSLWAKSPTILYPDWLYSRAINGSRDFIAIWKGRNASTLVHPDS